MQSNLVKYNKSFYTLAALETARRDYRQLAEIELTNADGYYICAFQNCVIDADRIIHEFDNYLIELLNSQGTSEAR